MKNYKQFVGEVLTSSYLTWFIKVLHKKDIYTFKSYKVDLSNTADFIRGSIFFRLYERSEIKTIKKFMLSNYSVIELGASLGIISLAINSGLVKKPIVSIEANPKLIANLKNTKSLNKLTNWTILNYALDYSGLNFVKFTVDPGNLGSHKSHSEEFDNCLEVPSITLKEIYENHIKNENFVLISDIEGAEIEFVLNEQVFLQGFCKQLILELHDTEYKGVFYSKSQIAELIKSECKMTELFNDSKTWVFNNEKIA